MVVKGKKIDPVNPKKVEPEVSYEEESPEEESETESEPGQAQVNQISPNSTVKKVGIEPSPSSKAHSDSEFSSSEEESEPKEDSRSESEGGGDYVVVPSAPKLVSASQKSSLADGKAILKESATPSKAGNKRTTEATETKAGKKSKKVVDISHGEREPTSSKKKLERRPKGEVSVSGEAKKQPFEKISQTVVASPKPNVARKKQIEVEAGHNGKSVEMKMENGKSEHINAGMSEDTKMENEMSEDIMVNGYSDNLVRMLEIARVGADVIPSPSFDMDVWIRSIGSKLYKVDDMRQGAKEWCQLAVEEIELYNEKLALMSARAKLVISGLKSKIA